MPVSHLRLCLMAVALLASATARGAGVPTQELDDITVTDRGHALVGRTDSASVGMVYAEQFANRPLSRPGELLEVVPGLIVTQHSGEAKANQYFLRGFNLDHGTDFATWLDGMPLNMPTHGHGQGYNDANFLIPELVDSVEYRKGPYYADSGDFSSAGSALLRYRDTVESRADLGLGLDGYARLLLTGAPELGDGRLLYGIEGQQYDGPWVRAADYQKLNGVLRYSQALGDTERWQLSLMAYGASNDSTDQIPQRAVQSGQLDRLGNVDDSVTNDTYRYSLSGDWSRNTGAGQWRAAAYAIRYRLQLYSNFTYFLDDPVNGDQFEQFDERSVYGGQLAYRREGQLLGLEASGEIGVQARHDDIGQVGLYKTAQRQRLSTVREDGVQQFSRAVYADARVQLTPWLRALAGLRLDRYDFDVASNLAANSGKAADDLASPKFGLVFGPFAQTELFVNYGRGFHSNDGRGSTITLDPSDGVTPADRVDPLVPTRGLDLGLRSALIPQVQLALSLFRLEVDSELLFIGDAGTTEASRPSERTGVELGLHWRALPPLLVDADLAYTQARFSDSDPAGERIPGAVEGVAALGVTWDAGNGIDAGLRLRHFGPRPLIEDNSVRSNSTTVVNAHLGWQIAPAWSVAAEVLNLFDSRDNDITYFYESQLPGEAAPVADLHFHPVEPVTARLRARYSFL